MSLAGLHAIRSVGFNNTYVSLTGINPPSAVVGLTGPFIDDPNITWPPIWNITAVGAEGSNLYTVSWKSDPIVIIPGDGLNVENAGPSPAANFRIEPAGDNIFRFEVPDEDRVWTLHTDGTPQGPDLAVPRVTLEPDTGLPGQRWTTLDNLD